jgi:2-methylcitrate dehydratase PrpD
MSFTFSNTAPGCDEELRNSVFFERGLHAMSICGAVGAAVAVAMLQGQDEAMIASAAPQAVRPMPRTRASRHTAVVNSAEPHSGRPGSVGGPP